MLLACSPAHQLCQAVEAVETVEAVERCDFGAGDALRNALGARSSRATLELFCTRAISCKSPGDASADVAGGFCCRSASTRCEISSKRACKPSSTLVN